MKLIAQVLIRRRLQEWERNQLNKHEQTSESYHSLSGKARAGYDLYGGHLSVIRDILLLII